MSGEAGEKTGKNGSFHETDSFDEPKGAPISMEPVFSTAHGVRINVKQESIDKSKKLLNSDLKVSTSNRSFSSPLLTQNKRNNAFVSPFRRDEPNISSSSKKRPNSGTGDYEGPPPKKTLTDERKSKKQKHREKKTKKAKEKSSKKPKEKEIIEMTTDVLRISRVFEHNEMRMVLQETEDSPLVLAKAEYKCGKNIKFGDKVHVQARVLKKNEKNEVTEIFIDKVLKTHENGARLGISRHSISHLPFCLKPKFIHELSNEEIKKTVLQVNILDLNLEIYDGCDNCKHMAPSTSGSNRRDCKHCKNHKAKTRAMVYSRMRVMDFSGQIFVNAKTKAMEKLLNLYGYEGVEQWIQFKEPQERSTYVFQPIMIEVERSASNEWECTDVAEVEWPDYNKFLIHKVSLEQRRLEKAQKKKEKAERKKEKKKKKEAKAKEKKDH